MRTKNMFMLAVVAVALAACGDSATAPADAPVSDGGQTSAAHNEADATFVRGMIPHHAQAVQMSELAPDKAGSQQVKDLAAGISAAQGPEIEQLRGFLRGWGLPAGSEGLGGIGGVDHGTMSDMSGMMSDQQMQQLRGAQGAAFDRMFLQMMIEHHTGAIQMSETELRGGQSPEAKALAQKIIDTQRAEIERMRELVKTV